MYGYLVIVIVLGISLLLIAIFHNKINKMKLFSPMKTISCNRYEDNTEIFQQIMIFTCAFKCLNYLIDEYGEDNKYSIILDTYVLYLHKSEKYVKVTLCIKVDNETDSKYVILLSPTEQESYVYDTTSTRKPLSDRGIIKSFISDLDNTLMDLFYNHIPGDEYDKDLFEFLGALDYYIKGDFRNEYKYY